MCQGADFSGVKSSCLISSYYVETARHRRQRTGHYAIIKRGLPGRAHRSPPPPLSLSLSLSLRNNNLAEIACGSQLSKRGGTTSSRGPGNCIKRRSGGIPMRYVDRSRGLFRAKLAANNTSKTSCVPRATYKLIALVPRRVTWHANG